MIHLYIVRHGETEENVAGILQGHLQGHLTERGRQQARDLRDKIQRSIHPQALFTSDLQRTLDTANILNEAFQLPLRPSPLLRERDWGEYTGHDIATLPKGEFPPSVESVPLMMLRAKKFLSNLYCEFAGTDTEVLLVSHGVFSRCLQAAALEKNIWEIPKIQNGEMCHIALTASILETYEAPGSGQYKQYDHTESLSNGKEN